MIRRRSVFLTAILIIAFLTIAASCAPVKDAIAALQGSGDDVVNIVTREANPSDFSGLSTRLKGILKDVPENATITPVEQQQLDNAAQTAKILDEIAGLFAVSDDIKALINKDSVLLAGGSFRKKPSDAFAAKLDEAVQNILKDTACGAFYDEMNAVSPKNTGTLLGAHGPATLNTVYGALTQAIADANYMLSNVQEVVDLTGLSSQILSTAKGYVGKAKKTVTAAAWNNGGATRAYLQICVFSK